MLQGNNSSDEATSLEEKSRFFGELSLHLQRNPQVSGSEPEAPSPYDTRHLIASLHEEV